MTTYKQYTKKSGEKKWMASGYLGVDPKTGKEKRTTLRGFNTKLEAKDGFEKAIHQFKHTAQDSHQVKQMTYNEVFDLWWPIYSADVEESTAYRVNQLFKLHILPAFGNIYIDQIETIDAQRWVSHLAQKMSSARKIFTYARKMMNFAIRMQFVDKNPFDFVELPRKKKQAEHLVKQNYYSLGELQSFLTAIDAAVENDKSIDGYWIKGKAFLVTTVVTGLRRGEMIGLKWSNIDFENHTLTINHSLKRNSNGTYIGTTKTITSNRTVHLDDAALTALKDWRLKQAKWFSQNNIQAIGSDMWIFTTGQDPNKYLSENTPRRWMVELEEKYKIRRVTLHGLRHTKATLLSEAGANPQDIAAILGHTNASFTMSHYVHPTNTGIAKAEQLFDGFIGGRS